MPNSLADYFQALIDTISKISVVQSIGKSGVKMLPEKNESDIDIFVFCNQIPNTKVRSEVVSNLDATVDSKVSDTGGRFWGICDFIYAFDTEICVMYFTTFAMNTEIESVLSGARLDREDEYFYPTGRCASILSMHILYDREGYLEDLKNMLSTFPQELSKKLVQHHIEKVNDTEDFNRAVSRQEVLFYHSTLESAMDHFLQALFAYNHCFFPSRKRTIQFINDFTAKPQDCVERLLQTIELGSKPNTLSQSYEIWLGLCKDFAEMVDRSEES